MLCRGFLATHIYEKVNLGDFQCDKKNQKLKTLKSSQCIKIFEVKTYSYFGSEGNSKLYITVEANKKMKWLNLKN